MAKDGKKKGIEMETDRNGLAVSKVTVEKELWAGKTVTFVISLVNSGKIQYTDVVISDDLGGGPIQEKMKKPLILIEDSLLYYVNGVLQKTPEKTVNPLVISGITVPAGGNVILVYEAQVNENRHGGKGGVHTESKIYYNDKIKKF